MKVKWLGHAAFLITAQDGTKVITDPYEPGGFGTINYGKILEAADVVTVSHDHADHGHVAGVPGKPEVVRGTGTKKVKGIEFKGIPTAHDLSGGKERGLNTVFCMTVDGVRVCHLGDLGHPLSDKERAEIGAVDVLLAPVGGTYTLDAAQAQKLADQLQPRVVIPMHYRTEKCLLPIAGVEGFLKGRSKVQQMQTSEVEFKKESLPAPTQTIVLKYAL